MPARLRPAEFPIMTTAASIVRGCGNSLAQRHRERCPAWAWLKSRSTASVDQGIGAPCNTATGDSPCDLLDGVNKPAMPVGRQLLDGFQAESDGDDE